MLKNLKEKAGYISIETIIVAGLIFALGAYGLALFSGSANDAIDAGTGSVDDALGNITGLGDNAGSN